MDTGCCIKYIGESVANTDKKKELDEGYGELVGVESIVICWNQFSRNHRSDQ